MKIVNYGLNKDQQQKIKQSFPKAVVKNLAGRLTLRNLPPKDAEIITIHTDSSITSEILVQLPNLKLIVTRTVGLDHIDLAACKRHKVQVVNCPGLNATSVAEFTMALMLSLARNMVAASSAGRKFDFGGDFRLFGSELSGKTLGIVGTGAIGEKVAVIAKGFGMKLTAFDVKKNTKLIKATGIKYSNLKNLFKNSDIITLHVPAIKQTEHLVNNALLANLKPGSILINTARGSVVEAGAVVKALESGRMVGYGADVLEHESWLEGNAKGLSKKQLQLVANQKRLAKHPNVLFTPHIAHATVESNARIFAHTIEVISQFLKGKKISSVI